ncbi:MAG: hypothetical protein AAFX50_23085, partial [Acidobacteriota bacterium]
RDASRRRPRQATSPTPLMRNIDRDAPGRRLAARAAGGPRTAVRGLAPRSPAAAGGAGRRCSGASTVSRRGRAVSVTVLSWAVLASAPVVWAGSFSVAGESLGEDSILHPAGYDGGGGPLELTVCLDPTSPSAVAASATLRFAVETWNGRAVTANNVRSDAGVPPTEVDFESEALRGLGLCLGLDDPSDASGFTAATNGDNNVFQRDDGLDDVDGTRDDLRGDDGNLMWFRFFDNDPFTVSATVDSTTYALSTAVLPEGDTFAATPTRAVAAAVGDGAKEAVMVAVLPH